MRFRIVVIGASKGGLLALERVLGGLPVGFPVPVAIVLHRSKRPDNALVPLLTAHCVLPVAEAVDKAPLLPATVLVAPCDYHLLVDGDHVALCTEAPFRFARPSIDLLFESAANTYGPGALGIVLTGSGDDGARGSARIRALGGVVLVQDPATAEDGAMPRAALKAARDGQVLDLSRMAGALVRLCAVDEVELGDAT